LSVNIQSNLGGEYSGTLYAISTILEFPRLDLTNLTKGHADIRQKKKYNSGPPEYAASLGLLMPMVTIMIISM
jgi:hypothetical protein